MIRLLALDIDGTLLDSQGPVPHANRTRSHGRSSPASRSRWRPGAATTSRGRSSNTARSADAHPQQRRHRQDEGRRDADAASAAARDRRGRPRARAAAPRQRAVVFDRPREGQVVFEAIDWSTRATAVSSPRIVRSSARCAARGCLTEDPIQVMFSGGCVGDARAVRAPAARTGRVLRGAHGIRAPRLLARRRRPRGLLEGLRAARLGGASAACRRKR